MLGCCVLLNLDVSHLVQNSEILINLPFIHYDIYNVVLFLFAQPVDTGSVKLLQVVDHS
jgi:hypothetical protein